MHETAAFSTLSSPNLLCFLSTEQSSLLIKQSEMLLHYPPLLGAPLTSTVNPSRKQFTLFNTNTNLGIFATPRDNGQTQRASSSNSEQTQITEKRIRAEDDTSEEDEGFTVVSAVKTIYNDIFILDTPKSMVLLLDETHNVHSIFYKGKQGYWTDSYWDEFAALPPIIPAGPIAIYGLGGGTAAHILDSYPHLEIEGWEIDGVLVDKARDYLGLKKLEAINDEGGVLNVFVGDALTGLTESSNGEEEKKYAGIIVDLFSNGKVLNEMKEKQFWAGIKKRLQPGGRVMVNCGGVDNVVGEGGGDGEDEWVVNFTIKAMWEEFKGELCWKKMQKMEGANYMAVTGEMPDLGEWESLVPEKLKAKVWGWMPFPNVPMQ